MTQRYDNFTDAAFAFAVTLLVIGGTGAPSNFGQLVRALGDIPAFAIGFSIIVLFWLGHVRWRRLRGEGDIRSIWLTLLLVFLVLIYVQPLRAMAAAAGIFFTGQGSGFRGDLAGMFAVYGTGFVAMSFTMAALFSEALRDPDLDRAGRASALGERAVWLILAVTGLISILISTTPYGVWAAMVYATLPISIGLFSARHDWTGERTTATPVVE
ncbi:MAG TPA: TMEM175 family protein [Allosphingosinicella sp.]|uniref:TMEM175 family protein n=1 Tax=Allosphingosinicella sp. TaxID=2823234 RepID=UPI002F27EDE5